MQTVRSGVMYAVGSFSAQMCPAKAASLASTGVHLLEKCTFLGCSRPSELLFLLKHLALSCNYIFEVILLHVAVLRCIYDQ